MYIYAPLLDAFKNISAVRSDKNSVEIGGHLMAAQVELVTDTNLLKNQAGDKVWVVCAIILGKQE